MKEYKRQHIIKHALEHYIQRPGASEKDLNQEKKVLKEVTEDIENMKERYGIDDKEDTEGFNKKLKNLGYHLSAHPAGLEKGGFIIADDGEIVAEYNFTDTGKLEYGYSREDKDQKMVMLLKKYLYWLRHHR